MSLPCHLLSLIAPRSLRKFAERITTLLLALTFCSSLNAEVPTDRLTELRDHAMQSLSANDREAAAKATEQILELCKVSEDVVVDDPERIRYLIIAAQIDFDAGQPDRAIQTLSDAARDAAPGSAGRVTSMAYLVRIDAIKQQINLQRAVETLAESIGLTDEQRALYDEVQSLVIDALAFSQLANLEPKNSVQQNFTLLQERLAEVEQTMTSAEIPVGVTRLVRLALAEYCMRVGMDDSLETVLRELRSVIDDDQVAAQWRAKYWSLVVTLRLKRRQLAEAYDAAREFSRQAKRTGRPDLPMIANDMLALVALQMGDYREARKLLESSRAFQQQNPDLRSATDWRINLAKAIEGDRDFIIARNELIDAQKTLQTNENIDPLRAANVANNLGINYYLTGDFDKAAELTQSAKQIYQANVDPADLKIGESSINLGWIAMAQENLPQAAEHFSNAAKHFKTHYSVHHPRYSEAIACQARVACLQGDLAAASQWVIQAEDLAYQGVCQALAKSPSARDRLALIQEARVHPESVAWPGTLDTFLELAPQLQIPDADQYNVVLRWKGLADRYDQAFKESTDAGIMQREQALMQQLHQAYFRRVSLLRRRGLLKEIADFEDQLQEIRRSVSHKKVHPRDQQPTVDTIALQLSNDELMLDILQTRVFVTPTRGGWIGAGSYYVAFVMDHRGRVKRVSFGDAKNIDAAIVRWRKTIIEQLPDRDVAAGTVARLVQQPLLDCEMPFSKLRVRGDSMFYLVPWAALPAVNRDGYWIEQVAIELASDVERANITAKAHQDANKSLLVAGGIDYGPLTRQWPALPGSLTEAKQVEALFHQQFPSARVMRLSDTKATEAALASAMVGQEFIHLATHGFFRRENTADAFAISGATTLLSTGLIVAPARTEDEKTASEEDQYMTAAEIRQLNLSRTSLVMLSACESGLGQAQAGQGMAGMFSSFHAAGAENVIGTLWPVDDAATVAFVERFYDHLWRQGKSVTEAIRGAQIDMLSSADSGLRSHPYAWAAFVCSSRGRNSGIAAIGK